MGIKWIVGSIGVLGAALLSVSLWSGESALRGPAAPSERGILPSERLAHASSAPAETPRVDLPPVESPARARSVLTDSGPRSVQMSGTVVDTEGKVLHGAWVRWAEEPASGRVHAVATDAAGAFALSLEGTFAPDSQFGLEVVCDGFVPVALDVVRGAGLRIELLRLPQITGRVLDPEGRAAAPPGRVQLTVLERGSGQRVDFETELEAGGQFACSDLPLGQLVRVSVLVRGTPELEVDLARALEPQAALELELTLESGVVVVGTVLDEATGLPVEGASVWADAMDFEADTLRPTTLSDGLGRFELKGVNADLRSTDDGREYVVVWVLANAPGYTSARTRAFAASRNERGRYEFELSIVRSSCSLAGIARDGISHDPVSAAHVHAIDSQGVYTFAQTDADGRFAFEGLPEGPFALALRKGEFADPDGCTSALLQLTLAAGAQDPVELTLLGPGATGLGGRVVDSVGMGVAGIVVTARRHFTANGIALELDSKSARTDAAGHYSIEGLSPGRYGVALELPHGQSLSSNHGVVRLELERGQWAESVDYRMGPSALFGGRIFGAGEGYSRYRVEVHAPDASTESGAQSLAETRVGQDGEFVLPPLLAELYELRLLLGERIVARMPIGPAASSDLFIALDASAAGGDG